MEISDGVEKKRGGEAAGRAVRGKLVVTGSMQGFPIVLDSNSSLNLLQFKEF